MSDFKVGLTVKVEGEKGTFTVVKVHKSSCKLINDSTGKYTIKPFPFLTVVEKSGGKSRKRDSGGGAKTESRKRAPAKSDSYTRDDDDEDDGSVADEINSAPAPKKRNKTVDDNVASSLAECNTPTQMIDAVKHAKDYEYINTDAFKRLVSQKNDLAMGLFRMRAGNLMRGAASKAAKAKEKAAKKK